MDHFDFGKTLVPQRERHRQGDQQIVAVIDGEQLQTFVAEQRLGHLEQDGQKPQFDRHNDQAPITELTKNDELHKLAKRENQRLLTDSSRND